MMRLTLVLCLFGASWANHESTGFDFGTTPSTFQCAENEEYSPCGPESMYQKTCAEVSNNVEVTAPSTSCQPGCQCKPGYVRENSYYYMNVKCVRIDECPITDPENPMQSSYPCYGENERYNFCGSSCEASCDTAHKSTHELQPECVTCEAKCECLPGYIRQIKGGLCIPEDTCPRDHMPCNENESYSFCGSAMSCDDLRRDPGDVQKTCNEGCYCNPGYVRNAAGKCVEFDQCPIVLPVDCQMQNNLTAELSVSGKKYLCNGTDPAQFADMQSYTHTNSLMYAYGKENWCAIVPEYSALPLSGDSSMAMTTYMGSMPKPFSRETCEKLQNSECAELLRASFEAGPISFNDAVNEIKACRVLKFQCNDEYCNIREPSCEAASPGDLIMSIGSDTAQCTKDGLFTAKQISPLGYQWCALVPDISPKPLSSAMIFKAADIADYSEAAFSASCEQITKSNCAREVRRQVELKGLDIEDAIEKSPRCDLLKKQCTGWSCEKPKRCGNQHLWNKCVHGQHGCNQKCGYYGSAATAYGPVSPAITKCMRECKNNCECLSGYREDRSQACIPRDDCIESTKTMCEKERHFTMENMVLYSRNGAGVPYMPMLSMDAPFIPSCDADGSYASVQSHNNVNLQWCALVPDMSTEPLTANHMFNAQSAENKIRFSKTLFEKTCEKIKTSICADSVRELMLSGVAFKKAVAMTKSCKELAEQCSGYRCIGDPTDPVATTSTPGTTIVTTDPVVTTLATSTTVPPKVSFDFTRLPELKCSEMEKASMNTDIHEFGKVYYTPKCTKKGSYDGLQKNTGTGHSWCPLVKDRHPAPLHKGYVYEGNSKTELMRLKQECKKLQKSKCSKTIKKALDKGACFEKAVKAKDCKSHMKFVLNAEETPCQAESRNNKDTKCTTDGLYSMVQQKNGLYWCVNPDAASSRPKFTEIVSYIRPTEAECGEVLKNQDGGKSDKQFKKLCKFFDKNLVYDGCAKAEAVTCENRNDVTTTDCWSRCSCKKGYVFDTKNAKCKKEKYCK